MATKRKTTSVKSMITTLQNQGVSVRYRKRSDGGYLITRVGSTRFTGAKGNAYARQVLGVSLTKKQQRQRASAFAKSPIQFNKSIREQIRKTNKAYRESAYDTFNDKKKPAKTNISKLRFLLDTEGQEKAIQSLINNQRYAQGYAYPKNIDALLERIRRVNMEGFDTPLVINRINSYYNIFRDEWIQKINSVLYTLEDPEKNVNPRDAQNEIIAIIN